jgi:hypothetical protein
MRCMSWAMIEFNFNRLFIKCSSYGREFIRMLVQPVRQIWKMLPLFLETKRQFEEIKILNVKVFLFLYFKSVFEKNTFFFHFKLIFFLYF